MAVAKEKCRIVETIPDTIGGTTYVIKLPGEREAKRLCFRPAGEGGALRCERSAGWGTDHKGTGACKRHGGVSNPRITTGMGARVTRLKLKNKIDEYLSKDRDELLDLTYNLAATRAIFDEFIEEFPQPGTDDYGIWFNRYQQITGTLGTLVEKISRVDSRNSLTAAQVLYIKATMIDLIMKFIPDPDIRERFARELAYRLGGDDYELTMKRSEISLPRKIID